MVYVYDGTWNGLMCLVYQTAEDGKTPQEILRNDDAAGSPSLFEVTNVENDPRLAEATASVLKKRVSGILLSDAWFALLSCEAHRHVDMAIWHLLACVWAKGRKAEADLADECVHAVRRAALRTGREYNKFLGVLRFKDVGGIFYAEIEPDCDVITLLAEHFSSRLSDQGWVLYDLRRKKAAVYNTTNWVIMDMNLPQSPSLTEREKEIQELWRNFYRSTTTFERLNRTVQRGNMPKKYWKHLVEIPGGYENV